MSPVGAYCIRPTKRPEGANTCLLDALFSSVRVGAYCIRPTNDPAGANTYLLDAPFSSVRMGRKRIRPTKRPERGDLIYLWVGVFIPAGYIYGAYSFAPYPAGRRYFYRDCHQIFSGIHPFLALMQEKDAKRKSRHQGCRPIWPGT